MKTVRAVPKPGVCGVRLEIYMYPRWVLISEHASAEAAENSVRFLGLSELDRGNLWRVVDALAVVPKRRSSRPRRRVA